MLLKDLSYAGDRSAEHRARAWAMATLRAASRLLDRLAARLDLNEGERHGASDPLLEFHAEAGAPEGALYVDGRLVGHLEGVTRL